MNETSLELDFEWKKNLPRNDVKISWNNNFNVSPNIQKKKSPHCYLLRLLITTEANWELKIGLCGGLNIVAHGKWHY